MYYIIFLKLALIIFNYFLINLNYLKLLLYLIIVIDYIYLRGENLNIEKEMIQFLK